MFLCQAVSNWKRAISFLCSSSFKLSILVSLKTFKQSVSILFNKFGLLFLFFPLFLWLTEVSMVLPFICSLILFLMILIVRPSIERKDSSYFYRYFLRIIGFVGLSFVFSLIYFISKYVFSLIFLNKAYAHMVYAWQLYLILYPWFILTMLAYLDTSGGIKDIFKAVLRGFKILAYYFPTVVGVSLVNLVIFYIAKKGFSLLDILISNKVLTFFIFIGKFYFINLLVLLFLCVITALYLRIKHARYTIFFK